MKWEYKTVNIKEAVSFWGGKFKSKDLDEALNKYGIDGWELVSTISTNKGYGHTGNIFFFFKRPIE